MIVDLFVFSYFSAFVTIASELRSTLIAVVHRIVFIAATLEDPARTAPPLPNDPLVAHGWEKFAYLGAVIFVVLGVAIVGIISRKVEHALVFALVLSLGCIGFFWVFSH